MTDQTLRASQLDLAPLREYQRDTSITSQVTAINTFNFSVFYQNDQIIPKKPVAEDVATKGFEILNEVLRTSKFHRLHDLTVETQAFGKRGKIDSEKPIVTFTLDHDKMGCKCALFDDRLSITRPDSSFENFYEWYRRIMPHAARIESTFRQIVENSSHRSMEVVQSQFEFTINFGDFLYTGTRGPAEPRNVDILRALIPSLPDEQGEMRELTRHEFYRLDLTLARLERFKDGKVRNAWYFMEAPFNENGRYLVFRCQLRNASTELPGTDRHKPADISVFDPDFSNDYRMALEEFLRDRALEGIAARLFETWKFDTPRRI